MALTRGESMKKLTWMTALLADYVLNDMVGAFAPMAQEQNLRRQ